LIKIIFLILFYNDRIAKCAVTEKTNVNYFKCSLFQYRNIMSILSELSCNWIHTILTRAVTVKLSLSSQYTSFLQTF